MSRKKVLELLRSEKGGYLSGEDLSRRLGLSRTAIWKAVDGLRREGYEIEAPEQAAATVSPPPRDALTGRDSQRSGGYGCGGLGAALLR